MDKGMEKYVKSGKQVWYDEKEIILCITQKEYIECIKLAHARHEVNSKNGIKDKMKSEGRGKGIECIISEVQGYAAELAVANHFMVKFDDSTHSRGGGYDILVDEKKVDVKCCLKRNNCRENVVISESKKVTDCDYYYFTKLVGRTNNLLFFSLYGWISSEDAIREDRKIDGLRGYWIPKSELKEFE